MQTPATNLLPDPPPAEPGPNLPMPNPVTTSRSLVRKSVKVRLPVPDNALPSPKPSPSEIDSRASDVAYYSRPPSSKMDITFIMLTLCSNSESLDGL
jgi:hypothetical protein